ncbi:MAG TPA: NAD(P)/FAD-dependent oxidoreductase [Acidimicrobiia bacterium]|nr:NAD(P)/FAD-dependent oxidoreductase [Acidimicrobiia bacterium]
MPRVVIVGGGFGGLQCARALAGKQTSDGQAVDVVLVDRRNYHLFTPLLYQVASCLISPAEITAPLRKVFRRAPNVRYRHAGVDGVDFAAQLVHLDDGTTLPYDICVLATGSVTNHYGNRAVEEHALGLKDLGEALQLRNHVLECLERATVATDPDDRRHLLTFCIVGGGPTGVEYAGALAELVRLVLPLEYREIHPSEVHIVLLEGGERVLPTFSPRLSRYAARELERRGVDVHVGALVASADDRGVVLRDGHELLTATMVWTAGVLPADPLHDPPRRIEVDDHFRVEGTDDVYAIGDVAAGTDRKGNPLPMVSPPAMQAGRFVAREILQGSSARPFRYRDKGTLATIGRTAAVGKVGPFEFTGFTGWLVWLVVHLYYLIGFENRLLVLMRWAWYYWRLDRPVRVIVSADPDPLDAQGPYRPGTVPPSTV